MCQNPLVEKSTGASKMDSSGRNELGIELLNQSNYRVWRTCVESYLVGEDLWDVVDGNITTSFTDESENANTLSKDGSN